MAKKLISLEGTIRALAALIIATSLFAPPPALAQISSRPAPMWEDYQKTSADIASDEKFVQDAIRLADGDRKKAAANVMQLGWQRLAEDPNHAIRAFNQAWLIEPDNPGIFWGFAVASHLRNDTLDDVKRWFDKTRELFNKQGAPQNAQLEANYGRVLVEREMPEDAIAFFEKALTIDPAYLQSHVALIEIAKTIGNAQLQKKHEELLAQKSSQKPVIDQ